METSFFVSFWHSDEETFQILPTLGGKIFLETGGEKYKGFWGAKRPKIQKFSRAKRAKTKKKEAFLLYISAGIRSFLEICLVSNIVYVCSVRIFVVFCMFGLAVL